MNKYLCSCSWREKGKKKQKREKIVVRFVGINGLEGMPCLDDSVEMHEKKTGEVTYWVEMIKDLMEGAGFNYSRIAYRIKCSPSTIQKLVNDKNRKPRHRVFYPLMALHYKIFQGEYATPKAKAYWEEKQKQQKD